MGSCFSKYSTKKPKSDQPSPFKSDDHVQEKSVISQSFESRTTLPLPAAHSSQSKSTSFSSSCMTTSCSSNSSSTLTSKERSFSNEFLWSCARENLHVIKLSSPVKPVLSFTDVNPAGSVTVLAPPVKQIILEKRARPGSPNLSRQKSFRDDQCDFLYGPQRMAAPTRSPSPSRRYEGELRRSSSPHYIPRTNYVQPSLRKQCSFRSASPNHNISRRNNWGNKQCSTMGSPLLCPKADRVAVRSVISGHANAESAEDMDNPLISLDCFIFL